MTAQNLKDTLTVAGCAASESSWALSLRLAHVLQNRMAALRARATLVRFTLQVKGVSLLDSCSLTVAEACSSYTQYLSIPKEIRSVTTSRGK